MIESMIDYAMQDHDRYVLLIEQHIIIDVVAIFLCVIIAVPLGYICAKHENISKVTIGISTLFMMIPSLALFALMMPIFGLGSLPAMMALLLGGLPLVIINTKSGYLNVDKAVVENAEAMGMEPWRVGLTVETPLALPSIINGIRIATISIIAGTTIATYIGAGGLGFYIKMGIETRQFQVSLLGSVTVAVIAIVTDAILSVIQKRQLKKVS